LKPSLQPNGRAGRHQPLRIAFVITSLDTGGAETMLFKLLERLDRTRFSPVVISLTTAGDFGPRLERIGVPVHAIGLRAKFPSPLRFLRLARMLSLLRPALVHTWMYHADLLGGLASRLAGVRPVVWGIRHSDLSREHNKRSTLAVVQLCARLSSALPARILSCSERARQNHVAARYAADTFAVIPNGFELDRFGPSAEARAAVRQELGLSPGTPLVGHVGRFHPQKNHAGLIEALGLVHREQPDVHFLLAGTDVEPANRAFWQLVVDARLGECCHALGRRGDVPRLMAALDVLASSSHGEAFPNVLGEAMACEVPCVVTDVGDCREMVGDTGRVVSAGNMQELASQIVNVLLLPPAQRAALGRRARERVAGRYEIGEVVHRYERFYWETAGLA
jgi:glycosyltransferase involved in cell wall biosynthesis